MDEATLPRDSLVAAAAVKIVAPHAPGAWSASEGSLLFCPYSFCLSTESFCGENLAGEAEAFLRLEVAFSCFAMDMRVA